MTVEGETQNSENPLKNDRDAYSKTKFRVMSLYFPSDYNEEVLLNLMKASHSFHLYFERDANKPNDIKKGGLSLSFGSEEAAKDAYVNARDKLINGTKIKLQGHKWFEQQYAVSLACDSSPTGSNLEIAKDADIDLVIPKDPNTHAPFVETVSRKESLELDEVDADIDVDRKLFVSQLLPTTDQDLIFAVFGQENLQNVQINDDNRKSDGTKSAILTFCSPELAEQSKQDYDGFVIDDGDMSKPMKITLYSEYLNKGSHKQDMVADTINEVPNIDLKNQDTDIDKIEKVNGILNIDDHKGKAGNLWSAQIVSNRSGDGAWDAIVKAETEISIKKPESYKNKNEENVRSVDDLTKLEPQVNHGAQFSGELSESEISRLIDTYVEANRVNYAELHSLEDLWSLVHDAAPMDKVGWQPEQTLKDALMTSLQNALPFNDAHWWQNHIEFLIKLWKRELDLECRSKVRKQLLLAVEMEMPLAANGQQQKLPLQTETKVANAGETAETTTTTFTTAEHSSSTSLHPPQKSSTYEPPPASPKPKRKGAGKRALIELMGVGAFLANVQKEHAVSAPEKSSDDDDDQSGVDDKGTSFKRKASKVNLPLVPSSSAPAPKRPRGRRSSSCESGEASSTSSEDGDGGKHRDGSASSDDDRGGTVHHKSRSRRRASAVATASPPPPPPARNRSERRQQQQQRDDLRTHGDDQCDRRVVQQANDLHSSQNIEHPAEYDQPIAQVPPPPPAQQQQQTWMAQMMPAMMQQFMPMMSQMFQNRMPAASAINTPQFQQQFMQLYQQVQSQIASGTMAASSAMSALSSNPMFAQLAQRMGAASTSSTATQQMLPQQQQHQVPYGSAGLGPGYHYR